MKSPLARALMGAGFELLKDRAKEELAEVERTPLGYIIRAVHVRQQQIKAEGRVPTEEDAAEFIQRLPDIVAFAKQNEDDQEGEQ